MGNFGGKFMKTRHIPSLEHSQAIRRQQKHIILIPTELESHKSLVNNVPACVYVGKYKFRAVSIAIRFTPVI